MIQLSIISSLKSRAVRFLETVFSGDSLKAKVSRGGIWLGCGSLLEQAARFGRNILLVRLLAPEVFGTMALILSACAAIGALTAIGVKEGLIRNPRGSEERYIRTAWWLSIFRAGLIYPFLFFTAPLFSQFYGIPELTEPLRVAGLAALFDGAISAKAYVALRDMEFKTWAFIAHGSGVIGVLVTVILSYTIGGVWALVLGYCAECAIRCVLSFLLCPFVPSWGWDSQAASELISFSKSLFAFSFLNFIFSRADIFVFGKLFSTADLGLYSLGILLVQAPTGFVMNMLGQTMLSAYSQIQTMPERINKIAVQVMSMILLLGIPAVTFAVLSGEALLVMAYGEPYRSAYGPFAFAAMAGLINILNGQITVIFYAKGLPQLHRGCVMLMAITMLALIYPCSKWLGIVGGQVASLIAVSAGLVFQLTRVRHLTSFPISKVAQVAAISLLCSSVVGIVFVTLSEWGGFAGALSMLIFGIMGTAVAATLGLFVAFHSRYSQALDIQNLINRNRT
jgi:O-antigen/teichoic acid export membrane protein